MVALLGEVLLPVFMVVAIGAVVGRKFGMEVASVNKLALHSTVPALAFRTMAGIEMGWLPALHLMVAYVGFMLAIGGTAVVLAQRWLPARRRTLVGTSVFGNAAYLNLPVAFFAFGDAGLERALVLYVVTALSLYALGPTLFGRASGARSALLTAIGFPVLWASVGGLALNASNAALPIGVDRAVDLLASAAVPVVLLSLGVQMATSLHLRPSGMAWAAVGIKLLLAPLVAALLGFVIGVRGLDLAVLVLLGGMPTAMNAAMLAVEFGGEAEQVGEAVLTGTALAFVTLPVVLLLVSRLV
jgi:malate permease and related proteins